MPADLHSTEYGNHTKQVLHILSAQSVCVCGVAAIEMLLVKGEPLIGIWRNFADPKSSSYVRCAFSIGQKCAFSSLIWDICGNGIESTACLDADSVSG